MRACALQVIQVNDIQHRCKASSIASSKSAAGKNTNAVFVEFEHVEDCVALELLRHQADALRLDAISSQV